MTTNLDFSKYTCDQCGACCKSTIVEADWCDAQREPKLYQIDDRVDKRKLRSGEHCIVLYDTEKRQCPFLNEVDDCSIYPTRPHVCVFVEAGDAKCQQSRINRGLPLLVDENGNPPSRELMRLAVSEYGLELHDVGFEDEESETL